MNKYERLKNYLERSNNLPILALLQDFEEAEMIQELVEVVKTRKNAESVLKYAKGGRLDEVIAWVEAQENYYHGGYTCVVTRFSGQDTTVGINSDKMIESFSDKFGIKQKLVNALYYGKFNLIHPDFPDKSTEFYSVDKITKEDVLQALRHLNAIS